MSYYVRMSKRDVSIYADGVYVTSEGRVSNGPIGDNTGRAVQNAHVRHDSVGLPPALNDHADGVSMNDEGHVGRGPIGDNTERVVQTMHVNHNAIGLPPVLDDHADGVSIKPESQYSRGPIGDNTGREVQIESPNHSKTGLPPTPDDSAAGVHDSSDCRAEDGSDCAEKPEIDDNHIRRLSLDSEDFHEWMQSLGPDDRLYTPFGCGSEELVYLAVARGCKVFCCVPQLVKGADTDTDFFRMLLGVPKQKFYAVRQMDTQRMRIKLLASYRLAVQKDRVRNELRTQRIIRGFETLGVHPAGRTYRAFADVFEQQSNADKVVEDEITKALAKALKQDAVYNGILRDVKGIGPAIAGYLIGCIIRPDRFPGIRSLWHYAGLHVDEKTGKAVKPMRGQNSTWNARLKTTLLGLLADQFVKREGPWREVYDKRKEYEKLRAPDMSKGHAHNRAKRYCVKQFIKWFWIEWMKLECPAKAEAS